MANHKGNNTSTRQNDERDLEILALVADGKSRADIANMLGVSRNVVCSVVHRVRHDDLALSGEPAHEVHGAYLASRS